MVEERLPESNGVRLSEIGEVVALYYKMFTGRPCRFASGNDRIGLFWEDVAALPEEWSGFAEASQNREWYLIAATHRAAHLEFHTFDLPIPTVLAERFKSLAPLSVRDSLRVKTSRDVLELVAGKDSRRSGLFAVVRVLEDFRVDRRLGRRYPGVEGPLSMIQRWESAHLAAVREPLPPRSKFARLIAETSLADLDVQAKFPEILRGPVAALAAVKERLESDNSSVLDSVVSGVRLWSELLRLPNMAGVYESISLADIQSVDFARELLVSNPEEMRLEDVPHLEGSEVLVVEIPEALYRDDLSVGATSGTFGLPLADALLVFEGLSGTGSPISLDEDDLRAAAEEDREPLPWETPPEPLPHEHVHDEGEPFHFEHGALKRRDAADFLYPEWDCYRASYRSDWVRVHETEAAGAFKPSSRVLGEASVRAYGAICRKLRAQLESIFPSGLSRVAGFSWGEEINLDAGVQMLVDKRSGGIVDDRVYEVQIHDRRDVAAALLMDISCSTAERKEPLNQFVEDSAGGWVQPELSWSESRSPAVTAKGYRTLLDIEIEMAAVISSVMEQIGDSFGLFAFSGSSRSEVVFQTLKEFEDRLGPAAYRRLDSLRPIHSTRIGAAVRHAARKLSRLEVGTKLLILLSDGRPFDVDYGPPD